jgi:hypothetical protein
MIIFETTVATVIVPRPRFVRLRRGLLSTIVSISIVVGIGGSTDVVDIRNIVVVILVVIFVIVVRSQPSSPSSFGVSSSAPSSFGRPPCSSPSRAQSSSTVAMKTS